MKKVPARRGKIHVHAGGARACPSVRMSGRFCRRLQRLALDQTVARSSAGSAREAAISISEGGRILGKLSGISCFPAGDVDRHAEQEVSGNALRSTWGDLERPGETWSTWHFWVRLRLEPPSGRLQARPGQAQARSSLHVAQNHGFPIPTHAKTKNPYGRQPEFNDYPLDSIGSWWDPTRSCWGWRSNVPPRKSKSVHRQS